MKAGIEAAAGTGVIMYIGAANYEGRLGQYRFYLRELFR
jgi:formylmethanofuran:tetrahydromethanopterin formyltransferase